MYILTICQTIAIVSTCYLALEYNSFLTGVLCFACAFTSWQQEYYKLTKGIKED